VTTFASIFHAHHRELIAYQPQVSFELFNFMELIIKSTEIGETASRTGAAQGAVGAWPTEDMLRRPVAQRASNIKNNNPSLIEPVIYGFPAITVTP